MRLFRLVCLSLLFFAASCFGQGAAFPNRPITIIVNSVAGGPVDAPARAIKDVMTALLGQPVIVDNRPGASGTTATGVVANAPASGYTLLMSGAAPIVTSPQLSKNLSYSAQGLAPLVSTSDVPLVLLVGAGSQVKTLADLVALAKGSPGKLTFASSGNGTPTQVAAESLKIIAGIDMVHVPYRGLPQMVLAVMSGEVSMAFGSATFMEQVRSGKLRALAVTGKKRLNTAPDVPTTADLGIPDILTVTWFGLFAPAGTPAPIQAQLSQAALKALADPQAREMFARYHGVEPTAIGPEEFAAVIQSDRERIWRMITSGGIKAE